MGTIQEIAKKAGVSVATVSHVVNRTRYVSPKLVKQVEDVINELDKLPKFISKTRERNINSLNNYIIIFSEITKSDFQRNVIREINESVSKYEHVNVITININDLYQSLEVDTLLNSERVVGQIILVDDPRPNIKLHANLRRNPTVLISEGQSNDVTHIPKGINVIQMNCYKSSYNAIKHLINNGHEKIAVINKVNNNASSKNLDNNIMQAYKQALIDNGISINKEYVINILRDDDSQFNNDVLQRLFYREDKPTALYVIDENSLMIILKFIESQNIKCPEDISIISYNDLNWLDLYSPAITSVKQEVSYIAKKSLNLVMDQVLSNDFSLDNIQNPLEISTNLQIRSSTGGIARGPFGEEVSSVEDISLTLKEKQYISTQKYTAVISFHYTGAAWMHLHEQGIRDVFNELGISILAVTDAHFDPEMQNKQLEGLMALDPDIVIAIPAEDNKTAETFKKISDSRAKLVLITNVPNGLTKDDYVSCVSVNEWSHGRLAGSGLGNSMRKRQKNRIGFITFDSDFYATNQRDAAARQIILEEYPELEIIDEVRFKNENDAFEKVIELLDKHPEIEGLYVSWEGPAIKVLEALREINRQDIIIGTADLDFSLALNMANEKNIVEVSSQLPYEQGKALALVSASALMGNVVPKFIGVEPIKVTRDNLIKSWEEIFKENIPLEIGDIIKN